MTTELPFNPVLGEVGSWTRLPDGGIGQVWALTGKQATVWVVDGRRYVDMAIVDLRHPDDAPEQDGLFG